MTATDKRDAAVARCKQEILADIAACRVPPTVARFCELHDYVDANEYGGATEGMPLLADDDSNIEECHANTDFWNAVHDEVDEWLRAGRPGFTRITHLLRFGPHTSVHLKCGHKFDVSPGDVIRQHLFIYKRYFCGECSKGGRA